MGKYVDGFTPGWNRGRALKFETPEILHDKCVAYFKECDEKKLPYTVSGLADFLDTSRVTLLEYQEKGDYLPIIAWAKQKCQRYAEEYLFSGKNPVGAIFNLKNNYQMWKEENTTNLKGGVSLVDLIKNAKPEQDGDNSVSEEDSE